jgi:hypothetical protein
MLGPESSEQLLADRACDLWRDIDALGCQGAAQVSEGAIDTRRSSSAEAARNDAPRVAGRLRAHALARAVEPAHSRARADQRPHRLARATRESGPETRGLWKCCAIGRRPLFRGARSLRHRELRRLAQRGRGRTRRLDCMRLCGHGRTAGRRHLYDEHCSHDANCSSLHDAPG